MSADYPSCLTQGPIDRQTFERDIVPQSKPVVFKGQAAQWPAVQAGMQGPQSIAAYLKDFDVGQKTPVAVLLAAENGNYFYDQSLKDLNYRSVSQYLPTVIDRLAAQAHDQANDRIYMQSLPVASFLPRFVLDNKTGLIDDAISPRIWIGNALSIQTHYDCFSNLACVVAGKRRFILFPPEQLKNLYPGPDDFTPGGTPVSMADIEDPDFEKYPRLREALKHAVVADMEPGDVLYLPYGWWHKVKSLSGFNVLVNYWWNEAAHLPIHPKHAVKMAWLTLRDLPPEQKRVWKAFLDYYIFDESDPVAHLPEDARGSFSTLDAAHIKRLKDELIQTLK